VNLSVNPNLEKLQAYPFEKLKRLFAGIPPNPDYSAISLGLGEPKHATPQLIKDALVANLNGWPIIHRPMVLKACESQLAIG